MAQLQWLIIDFSSILLHHYLTYAPPPYYFEENPGIISLYLYILYFSMDL